MGREIRRVPPDWEHPKEENYRTGRPEYKPLFDQPFREAAEEWHRDYMAWADGTHPDAAEHKADHPYYWMWNGCPPDENFYRPDWPEESRTAFQVYQNVSEGSPVSPVFATEAELKAWLMTDPDWHLSDAAAHSFIKSAWAPSMIISGGRLAMAEQVHEVFVAEKKATK